MLQQRGVAAAEPAPLGDQPAIELGAALDLMAIEEVARKQVRRCLQLRDSERLEALLRGAGDLDRIDKAAGKVERDGVTAGLDASLARLVEDASELTQAPPELAARIAGHIPQQLAQ